jgi:AcrR family transcriptional regulator
MTELARRTDRSSNFADTLSEMILTALRLTAERQGQIPSIAVVAHAMKMNRTTAYYYFQSPESLRAAIKAWTVDRLIECLALPDLDPGCMGSLIRFVLEQPYAVNLLQDDLVAPAKAGEGFARWDELVEAMQEALRAAYPGAIVDAEVHVAWMLAGAFNGPRMLQRQSNQDVSPARIVERFRSEERRLIPCAPAA